MSIDDDNLQRRMETKEAVEPNDADAVAYKRLFQILTETDTPTSLGIEDAVVAKIERQRKTSVLLDYVWLMAGIAFLAIVGLVAIVLYGPRLLLSGWQWNIVALAACAGVVVTLLNSIERRLLNR